MERYVCIHGHFYQPPRENPWLEAIELQDSAYPYHDWNERIAAECYSANAASRILDAEGRIVRIVSNYASMSFNVGPTLLAWLEEKVPDSYRAILEADKESQRIFGGHGSALAQAYNHVILPLANRRDKYTQVLWGIRDFEHRFGRTPEGMWLPETAVDLETLDVLAELGIAFTILAPHQASRARAVHGRSWRDISGGRIRPTRPYLLRLPSGRQISLFFYDGPISLAVAFEGILSSGEGFAGRVMDGFSDRASGPQLVHIATDGETYGHHHRHGDMALAYAVDYIQSNDLARVTNYGEYLEHHPPAHQVEIAENTSWSCGHGIERWRSDCGCNSGGHPGWSQAWREPLRQALDWLRDALAPRYESHAARLLEDPWAARDDYISVVLDRSPESVDAFLERHAARELDDTEKTTTLKLLELQRHAMLMYTSCGWFFDELSGVETVQVMQYAGRAIQLAEDLFEDAFEPRFLELLEQAKSNVSDRGNGRRIYDELVKPATLDLPRVGAHHAVSSLFEEYGERAKVYCYTVDRQDYQRLQVGETKLAVGRIRVASEITRDGADLSFGVLYFGDHNLSGGVREFQGNEAYQAMLQEVTEAFAGADLPETLRLLDKHYLELRYSLRSLFRDEQRKMLSVVLNSTLAEAEAAHRQVYEHHAPLMLFLADLGAPLPKAFHTAVEVVVNNDLRRALQEESADPQRVRAILDEAQTWRVELDTPGLAYALKQSIERLAGQFRARPTELAILQSVEAAVALARILPFEVDLWTAQNAYYEMLQAVYPEFRGRAEQGQQSARTWCEHFTSLGGKLGVLVA